MTSFEPASKADAAKPTLAHDSARASPELLDNFHRLVQEINNILGPWNGIDSTGVDVEELKGLMASYKSDEKEWCKYAFADASRGYTRNLVDRGNKKANLLILVWTPGKSSPIHDHADAHCVMKILKGRLTETVYGWPCEEHEPQALCATSSIPLNSSTHHSCSVDTKIKGLKELQIRKETVYESGQVTYISDRIGLHRVSNPSDHEFAVSLHLYTPPNAAKHGCHIFEQSTGKKWHVDQSHFFSELGVRM